MSTVYFAEEQWLWRNRILQGALASGVAFCALRWRAVGRGRALAEGISCAAAASFLATVRLDVRVGPGMLEIEFWPFVRRRIPSREIDTVRWSGGVDGASAGVPAGGLTRSSGTVGFGSGSLVGGRCSSARGVRRNSPRR